MAFGPNLKKREEIWKMPGWVVSYTGLMRTGWRFARTLGGRDKFGVCLGKLLRIEGTYPISVESFY